MVKITIFRPFLIRTVTFDKGEVYGIKGKSLYRVYDDGATELVRFSLEDKEQVKTKLLENMLHKNSKSTKNDFVEVGGWLL